MISGKNSRWYIWWDCAYKTAYLVREFIKAGADVKCVLTLMQKSL